MQYDMDWQRDHGEESTGLAGDSTMSWFGVIGLVLFALVALTCAIQY